MNKERADDIISRLKEILKDAPPSKYKSQEALEMFLEDEENKLRARNIELEARIKELEKWRPTCYETCQGGKYPQVSSNKDEPLTFYEGCVLCRFTTKKGFKGARAVIEREKP